MITGCSSGVGKATALLFSAKGYHVFAGVRREEDGQVLIALDSDQNIEPVLLDVTNREQLNEVVNKLEAQLEGHGLDALVNNAGIAKFVPLEFTSEADIRNIFEVNTMGPVLLTQALLPLLRKATGRIVFVGSIGGKIAFSFNGPYSISKFALTGYSDALRRELAPFGLKVSLLEPGSIDTSMPEKVREETDAAINELSPEARSYYESDLRSYAETLPVSKQYAATPEQAAKVIAHAVESPRPRAKYLVTPDARSIAFFNWLLPDRLFDPLLRKMTEWSRLLS
ncbi:MAG: SDR family oxidoreductase [Gammaproteobacteria bacterium]|nr:SDR family oxidoreductase [Gammaproteobacteria bacterium]